MAGADILRPTADGIGDRRWQLGSGLHGLAARRLLRVSTHPVTRVTLAWAPGHKSRIGRGSEGDRRGPARSPAELVDTGPMVLGLQGSGQGGHMAPISGNGHPQAQPAAGGGVVPRATGFQWANTRVQGRRHADTLPQVVVLPTPLVRGRDIHARTSEEQCLSYPSGQALAAISPPKISQLE